MKNCVSPPENVSPRHPGVISCAPPGVMLTTTASKGLSPYNIAFFNLHFGNCLGDIRFNCQAIRAVGRSEAPAPIGHPEAPQQQQLPEAPAAPPPARVEDDVKLDPVEMDIEEEGDRQPVHLPPEMGPAPMPEHHQPAPEPMAVDDELSPPAEPVTAPPAESEIASEAPELAPAAPSPVPPSDGIVVADEDAQVFELVLDEPLDKIHIRDFIKICLRSTVPFCLYCNHARRIAVNGKYLALHLVATHRFQATVNSITAEELLPATIVQRFKACLEELEPLYFNLETFDSSWTPEQKAVTYPKQFECFQCRFITRIHKELYLHNRKMHQKSVLICLMCRSNFFSYSELLCHMCPGAPNRQIALDCTFRCCSCNIDGIPSAFRLMVHLRKRHYACDICLEQCVEQGALSNHVWKHKLHHLCYRCGIAYRNKADILKHLFWKHGTEGVVCKRCLQKKWPHVYHFCVPPAQFICEVCQMGFRKSLALKVHRRLHNGEEKYPCSEDGCEKKFISKKLLVKHVQRHYEPPPAPPSPPKPKEPTPEPVPPPVEDVKPKEEDIEKVKEEVKDEGESKVKAEVKEEAAEESKANEETPRKKKKKRSKDDPEKSLVDLMNLPALNLSESDSSDDSDADHSNASSRRFPSAPGTSKDDNSGDEAGLPEPKREEVKAEEDEDALEKVGSEEIVNIWNNFKNYQASRANSRRPSLSDEVTEEQFVEKMLKSKVLHVSQSDHDYCMMFKKVYPEVKASEAGETIVIDDDGNMEKGKQQESLLKSGTRVGSPTKKQKSPRKRKPSKSGSDSSSSDSGSDSDSSCECGSNCSCSSSSSGSSSSSSDDSDSSDENNAKKKDEKKKKAGELQQTKVEEPVAPVQEEPPVEPPEPIDPDTVIHESDLETDESETDEEFYDEHPQKMASQLLAEKRRQLMQQTCMSPMSSFGIVENSRPSTPSLPEEMVAKKKVKLKKRKRERKITKKTPPPLLLQDHIPNIPPALNLSHVDQFSPAPAAVTTPLTAPPTLHSVESLMLPSASTTNLDNSFSPGSASKTPRLSTGNSSESDAPLKRSQRSRKPNKFYGYTSDDEIPPILTPLVSKNPEKSILSVMKPTPPPNLVWSKEDLPSPPKIKSSKAKPLDPSTPLSSRSAPPAAAPSPQQAPLQQPPRVDTTRIPTVPVHHVIPSPLSTPMHNDADSDSSQEGALQISQKPTTKSTPQRPAPPLPKLKLSVPKKSTPAARGTPKTPAARKRAPPKSKTPKSAPPVPTAAQNPPAFPPAPVVATPFQPPIVDPAAPKVPPLGSFPSIQSEFFPANQIRIPAGWRPPREGESVYCYCRCPYDEVSEMIACDGDNCRIEWFHFECVGIIMPPKGKWFCPECKLKQQSGGAGGAHIAANAELQDDLLDSN
ncbi:AAEL009391-PA [Aedes aegypti]|uniref:AAEL009391-PA n=1 Tax=Aedes aegypti TaxID=7159 RepID=Q16VZ0_AEDAE|nr:AAEL009391-PA [Aedes aegypti]